ncbi:MAG: VIT family protein [Proteobacteria bacterium]|nr:VIT family protein [Pseudomonadota bacterium]
MPKFPPHPEGHRSQHIGWLRAAVLGANDGIVSTASLILGVAAARTTPENIVLTGVAGLVAGAMSMAAGEYVSVSSQADTEKADLDRERSELATNSEFELVELTQIYQARGLDLNLATQVAQKLTEHDALESHARDELGISKSLSARPVQAALASAGAFAVGAILPLILVIVSPSNLLIGLVSGGSLIFLAMLGVLAAKVGGATVWKSALRVCFWGALAMVITAGIGAIFGGA